MYLVRLVYASRISDAFEAGDIASILESARANNHANHVTGALCFSANHFLQCLEGSRSKVNATYQQILNDKRHCQPVLLSYEEIAEREFSAWTMGYIPDSSLSRPINLRYSGNPEFTPFAMSGESALHMMLAAKEAITQV